MDLQGEPSSLRILDHDKYTVKSSPHALGLTIQTLLGSELKVQGEKPLQAERKKFVDERNILCNQSLNTQNKTPSTVLLSHQSQHSREKGHAALPALSSAAVAEGTPAAKGT